MVDWFFANFEDPVENMPHDSSEGGYQYIWGGPYDALDEIGSAFPNTAEDEIEAAVKEVQSDGIYDWAPVDQGKEPDDRDDDSSPPQRLSPLLRTPRFPNGISHGDLRSQPDFIQRETLACWFIENCQRAADGQDAYGMVAYGGGGYFNGHSANIILDGAFNDIVDRAHIDAVAAMFEGLWVLNPVIAYFTADDVRTRISRKLDRLATELREIAPKLPKHGGMGHNGPPEDESIAAEDLVIALKAVDDMRLAVSSKNDATVLEAIWSGLSPIADKLSAWSLRQFDIFFENFTPAAGKSLGDKLPYLLIAAVGLWVGHMNIAALIAMLLTMK